MYKAIILKHVAKPAMLMGSSPQAAGLTFAVAGLLSGLMAVLTGDGFLIVVTFISIFIGFHGLMIYLSYKDPYFLNVWIASLGCKKTKNFQKTGHNYYGS